MIDREGKRLSNSVVDILNMLEMGESVDMIASDMNSKTTNIRRIIREMISVRIPSVQRYNGAKQSKNCCQTEKQMSSAGMKAKSLPYLISFVFRNIF